MVLNNSLLESLTFTQLEERLEEVNDALGQIAFVRKYAYDEPYTSREEQEERLNFIDNGEAELLQLYDYYKCEIAQRQSDAEEGGYCPVCSVQYSCLSTEYDGQLEHEYSCNC